MSKPQGMPAKFVIIEMVGYHLIRFGIIGQAPVRHPTFEDLLLQAFSVGLVI